MGARPRLAQRPRRLAVRARLRRPRDVDRGAAAEGASERAARRRCGRHPRSAPMARCCSRSVRPPRCTRATGSFPAARSSRARRRGRRSVRELHEELGVDVERRRIHGSRRRSPIRTPPSACSSSASLAGAASRTREEHQATRVAACRTRFVLEPMLPANTPVLRALALPAEYAISNIAAMRRERVPARARRTTRRAGCAWCSCASTSLARSDLVRSVAEVVVARASRTARW